MQSYHKQLISYRNISRCILLMHFLQTHFRCIPLHSFVALFSNTPVDAALFVDTSLNVIIANILGCISFETHLQMHKNPYFIYRCLLYRHICAVSWNRQHKLLSCFSQFILGQLLLVRLATHSGFFVLVLVVVLCLCTVFNCKSKLTDTHSFETHIYMQFKQAHLWFQFLQPILQKHFLLYMYFLQTQSLVAFLSNASANTILTVMFLQLYLVQAHLQMHFSQTHLQLYHKEKYSLKGC